MNKIAIWLTTGILLIYFVFTSGLYYWASGCEVTNKLITPFSWALSAKEMGLTPIATKGDIDCIRWLQEQSDQDLMITCDTNATYLFIGHIGMNTFSETGVLQGRLAGIKDVFLLDQCYLFFSDWGIRYRKHIYCSDVGLRGHYTFSISDNGNGCLTYVANIPQGGGVIVTKTTFIKEVYRSGNARVYEKIE